MIQHKDVSDNELRRWIRQQKICLGGHQKLKIYGALQCWSGKRMKKENRVFFISEEEAIYYGYRPCSHCMKGAYKAYRQKVNQKHQFSLCK